MLKFINLPGKIIGIIEGNISSKEIAAGVCLGLFMGLIPLNGSMALLLTIFFFIFRINRVATLLVIPLVKSAYILGLSNVADNIGGYLLEQDFLASLWRWITHLPIIAYLDINNTLVAGGLALSAVLSIPVFIIAERIAAAAKTKYADKMTNSSFAKWVSRYKVINKAAAFTDKSSAAQTIKLGLVTRIKSIFIKRKGPQSTFARIVNIRGVIIAIVILAALHLGTGMLISPALGSWIIKTVNETSGSKISVGSVRVWPLTLSCTLKDVRAFDPEEADKRIVKIDDASVRVSLAGILSRRLVFSSINAKGAELDLIGYPDGSFNIQRLALSLKTKKPEAGPGLASLWRGAMEKRDLFGKIYNIVKNKFSKKGQQDAAGRRAASKQVTKTVEELPRGRLVHFRAGRDMYQFEVRKLIMDGARVNFNDGGGNTVEIKDARIRLGRLAFDPENGVKLDSINLKGDILKAGKPSGRVDFLFSRSLTSAGQNAVCNAEFTDIDLDAVRFFYEDSLPVHVAGGTLTLHSKTRITPEAIDSRNTLKLSNQSLEPKAGGNTALGLIPMPVLCDAINRIDPLRLKFDITGTVDKPEFSAFQESLLALVKPYIANIGDQIKKEGMDALGKFLKKQLGEKEQ